MSRNRLMDWSQRLARRVIPQSKIQNPKSQIDRVMDSALLAKLDRLTLGVGQDLIRGLMGEHRAQRRLDPAGEQAIRTPGVAGRTAEDPCERLAKGSR